MTIKKILVANRGEVAVRIIRACKEMGIKSVALCPQKGQEKNFWETQLADEFYFLNEEGVSGYLNQRKLIKIAKEAQVDAIHPGYGFLAENADFAQLCERNEIKFIGPSADILRKLGDKIEAKKIAKKCGLPVLPGIKKEIETEKEFKKIVKELKLPLILKSAGGGGGIGMEIIRKENLKKIKEILERLKRITKLTFGSEKIFVEKYLEAPRHIEFQIIGDGKMVFHLFERECSIQRRYQKLIEEAPSIFLDEKLREKMGKSASKLGRYLKYESLGTVEFLVDNNRNFYFIEVNPRLQVEHAVTELVTGFDLVKEQIKIAQGEKISFSEKEIKISAHAVEFRILAEDPKENFQPSFGKIREMILPGGKGIEIHSGYLPGQEILPYFDSLILKLVVWGKERKEALKRAKRAFQEIKITGVKTNIPLYKKILENQSFWEGKISTEFLEKEKILENIKDEEKEGVFEEKVIDEERLAFLLASIYQEIKREKLEKKNIWQEFSRMQFFE